MKKIFWVFYFYTLLSPTANAGAKMENQKLRLHDKISLQDSRLEFSRVVSDSRCPEGEECYWPGIFVAEFKLVTGPNEKLILLGNLSGQSAIVGNKFDPNLISYKNGPTTVAGFALRLDTVTPPQIHGKKLEATDYVLSLTIERIK